MLNKPNFKPLLLSTSHKTNKAHSSTHHDILDQTKNTHPYLCGSLINQIRKTITMNSSHISRYVSQNKKLEIQCSLAPTSLNILLKYLLHSINEKPQILRCTVTLYNIVSIVPTCVCKVND